MFTLCRSVLRSLHDKVQTNQQTTVRCPTNKAPPPTHPRSPAEFFQFSVPWPSMHSPLRARQQAGGPTSASRSAACLFAALRAGGVPTVQSRTRRTPANLGQYEVRDALHESAVENCRAPSELGSKPLSGSDPFRCGRSVIARIIWKSYLQ